MNISTERKTTTLLFNPFVYVAGGQALELGLVAILLAGLIGYAAHTHFDGVLDTHTGAGGPVWLFLAEGLVNWLCLSAMLWFSGKLVSKTAFRTIDVFGTQALARWPTVFIALLTLAPGYQRFIRELVPIIPQLDSPGGVVKLDKFVGFDFAVFSIVALRMLPLVVWMVALMYNAYSLSCNVRGGKAIGAFIAGLLLAEILSKIVIYRLLSL
jgi:hypothetical protein